MSSQPSKEEIHRALLEKFPNEGFCKVWWVATLPGLGKQRPSEVFEEDPARLLEYVNNY